MPTIVKLRQEPNLAKADADVKQELGDGVVDLEFIEEEVGARDLGNEDRWRERESLLMFWDARVRVCQKLSPILLVVYGPSVALGQYAQQP